MATPTPISVHAHTRSAPGPSDTIVRVRAHTRRAPYLVHGTNDTNRRLKASYIEYYDNLTRDLDTIPKDSHSPLTPIAHLWDSVHEVAFEHSLKVNASYLSTRTDFTPIVIIPEPVSPGPVDLSFTDPYTGITHHLTLDSTTALHLDGNGNFILQRPDGTRIAIPWKRLTEIIADIRTATPAQLVFLIATSHSGFETGYLWQQLPLATRKEAYAFWEAHLTERRTGEMPPLYNGRTTNDIGDALSMTYTEVDDLLRTSGIGVLDIISLTVDIIPIAGQIKGLTEVLAGKDLITGEEVSRLLAASGLVPLGKVGHLGTIIARISKNAWHAANLRKAMLAAGRHAPDGHSAHHIIASGSKNEHAQKARALLQKYGIDIDDPANGVFLPPSKNERSPFKDVAAASHATLHTDRYYEDVFNLIKKAIGQFPDNSEAAQRSIRAKLEEIGNQLARGAPIG